MAIHRVMFTNPEHADFPMEADSFTVDAEGVLHLLRGPTVAMFPPPHWRGVVVEGKADA